MIDYHPYTIYCEHGINFNERKCYFLIGKWLGYSSEYVILCHGKLSESEYQQYWNQQIINIFEDVVNRTVDIFTKISNGYLSKLGRNGKTIESYIQYIGCLEKCSIDLWEGVIDRK